LSRWWRELTGALAPLREEQFFQQLFIECGAVAWPGEIDLAPDAMYTESLRSSAARTNQSRQAQ
jgi:hypothetical protein